MDELELQQKEKLVELELAFPLTERLREVSDKIEDSHDKASVVFQEERVVFPYPQVFETKGEGFRSAKAKGGAGWCR